MVKKMMPLVSVIIPTYNSKGTIKRCVLSVLNQTLTEIEIIIIDDGSVDDTQNVLAPLVKQDNRITVIQTEHAGQGLARNIGLKAARGKYIGFVDADDAICESMYENLLSKAEKHNADVAQCNIINVFDESKYVPRLLKLNAVVNVDDRNKYFDKYLFEARHSFECCNKLIRNDFLKDNNILFKSNDEIFSEDLLFNLELAASLNTIVFTEEPCYCYYQYSDSHSKINNIEKIKKLCVLFDTFCKKEKKLRFECAKIAVLVIMINLSNFLNGGGSIKLAKEIIAGRDLKKYIAMSFVKTKRIRHKLLMLFLLCAPARLKLYIIKLYYARLK